MIANPKELRVQTQRDPVTGDVSIAIPYGFGRDNFGFVVLKIREHHHIKSAFGYWVKKNNNELRREVLTDLHNQIAEQLAILALED